MGYWRSRISNGVLLAIGESANKSSPLYKFYLELAESIRQFREVGDYSRTAYRNWDISKIAIKRGFNVIMSNGSEYSRHYDTVAFACVLPPQIDRNNPIIANFRRGEYRQNKDLEVFSKFVRDNQLQGTIGSDMTLGEDFTKIPFTVSLSPELLRTLDEYEAASAFLHEIGHVYYYFRFLVRSLMANGVADFIANKFMESEDHETRIRILTSAEALTGSKFTDRETLLKEHRRENIYIHIVSDVMMVREDIPGAAGVANSNWERLADHFVGQHGASDKLATGLFKLDTSNGWLLQNRDYDSFGAHYVVELGKILALVVVNITPSVLATSLGFAFLTGVGAWLFGDNTEDIYESPEKRYQSMRRALVEQLNDLKSGDQGAEGKAALQRLLDGIVAIDKILENVKEKDSLFTFVHKKMFPSGRKNEEVKLYNEDLEAFALNDLIVMSAKFKGAAQ